MLTEIGALVTIVKGLLDAAKTGIDLFGLFRKRKNATVKAVGDLQSRMAGIADQLHHSVALSKMLPIWLKDHAEVDLFTDALSDDDVRLLDSRLRKLISDSVHDHFSGTFFHTSFATLPGVDAGIKAFQERLLALEQQLNGIPAGDATAWRRAWTTIKVRMHDLRVEAVKIDNMADAVHASLIEELRQAAVVKAV